MAIKRGMRETLHLQEQRHSGTRLKIALAELKSYFEHLEAVSFESGAGFESSVGYGHGAVCGPS